MKEEQLLYTLALQHVNKVGDILGKRLLQHFGSAASIFKATKSQLIAIEGIGELTATALKHSSHIKAAEDELRFIQDNHIRYSYYTDEDYPTHLKHCVDGPILLFHSGTINLRPDRVISIVGTRKVTPAGKYFCEKLIEELVPLDPIIVSGFAYGVDIVAQRAAIRYGLQTIGCLAHGFEQIYPKAHQRYVADVERNGGFFTDFWSSHTFDRNNFLKRNRIIAGISEATVVIESAEKGGSLVTADIAHSYNRDVFAVPGRPDDTYSVGCNNLIKQQKAHVLTSAADLVYMLNWQVDADRKPAIQKQLFITLDDEEKKIFKCLKESGKELLDVIAIGCDLPVHVVATKLLSMEMKGLVRPLPGKLFELI